MFDNPEIDKVGHFLRSFGGQVRIGIFPADECFVSDRYFVAIRCEGEPFGEARGTGSTLRSALIEAVGKLDRKEAA